MNNLLNLIFIKLTRERERELSEGEATDSDLRMENFLFTVEPCGLWLYIRFVSFKWEFLSWCGESLHHPLVHEENLSTTPRLISYHGSWSLQCNSQVSQTIRFLIIVQDLEKKISFLTCLFFSQKWIYTLRRFIPQSNSMPHIIHCTCWVHSCQSSLFKSYSLWA